MEEWLQGVGKQSPNPIEVYLVFGTPSITHSSNFNFDWNMTI